MKALKKQLAGIKSNFLREEYITFFLLLILGIGSTLYVEYKFEFEQFKWLTIRALIISAAIIQFSLFPKKIKNKYKKHIFAILLTFIILFLLNFFLNSINIYQIHRFENIKIICQLNSNLCNNISDIFYSLKLYRFVSLTPYFFFYIIFMLFGFLYSDYVYKKTDKILKVFPKIKIKYSFLFYLLLSFILFQQLLSAFSSITKTTVRMIFTANYPYERRWEAVMGGRNSFGWIATYSTFVTKTVPDHKTILIPPQAAPWEMEGNPYYIRWFFYPRDTIHSKENGEIPNDAEYILITYGVFGINKKVYPDFFIEKEKIDKIFLVDRITLEENIIMDTDFIPDEFTNKWGVIKLK